MVSLSYRETEIFGIQTGFVLIAIILIYKYGSAKKPFKQQERSRIRTGIAFTTHLRLA